MVEISKLIFVSRIDRIEIFNVVMTTDAAGSPKDHPELTIANHEGRTEFHYGNLAI